MNKPLRVVSIIAMSLLVLATTTFSPKARDGPLIPEPTVTASLTATPEPTSTPTQTATKTPSPTPTQTATPTDAAIEITAEIKVRRCLFYRGLVEQWIMLEPSEFEWLTIDDIALVLAIGAAESGCDNDLISSAEAMGIMQVIPKPWTARVDLLRIPSVNIYWGMWVLDRSMNLAYGRGEGLEYALAYYNCSFDKVHDDLCGPYGGLHYADLVLTFWKPRVEQALLELED